MSNETDNDKDRTTSGKAQMKTNKDENPKSTEEVGVQGRIV
jgi:hypothetical protein